MTVLFEWLVTRTPHPPTPSPNSGEGEKKAAQARDSNPIFKTVVLPNKLWRGGSNPVLVVPLILAVLTLFYMMPFVRPPTGREALDGHDLVEQQYPLLSFIFDSVRNGHGLPLWNPYLYAGQSTVANPQSTLFYPPAWIMLPPGVPRGVGWLIAIHMWLGAWGMAVFTRRMGASWGGALVGGIVYSFSAVLGAHLGAGHLNYILCQAWLPWIAAAYLWSIERPRRLLAGLPGAVAFGMCVLAGYPPLLYFGVLWLGVLWGYVTLQTSPSKGPDMSGPYTSKRRAVTAVCPLLVIVIGGAILGAGLLLPTAEFTLRSTRTQTASLTFSNSYALPGGQLVTLLFPNLFGHPRLPDLGYWGLPFYEETTAYVGILPIVAIFLARRRPAKILFMLMIVLGLIVSVGIDGGLFPQLYRLLPGYSIFRVPSRALYFVTVGAAGVAALLITDLGSRDRGKRARLLRPAFERILPVLAGFAILATAAFAVYFTIHSGDPNPPWRALYGGHMTGISALMIAATWLALWFWRMKWFVTRQGFVLGLTMFVIVIDLWRISQPMVTVSAIDVPAPWQAFARAVPATPDFRVMTVPDRISLQAGATYTRHLNANGYDPLVGDAYQRLLEASQYNPTSRIARLLGVRYVLSEKPFEWTNMPGIERLTLLTQDGDWRIYEVKDAVPRAFVTRNIEVIADDETARQQLASDAFDPLTMAIVDQPVTCPSSGTVDSSAKIVTYQPNVVEIEATGAGVLVLTDSYDPNWVVSVNDQPSTLLRVNTALRGVCLSDGNTSYRIRFEYRPVSFFVGVGISVVGWLVLGVSAPMMVIRKPGNVP